MDMHHLRIFLSVFGNRSFSSASRELYLTQPTISDHIKALEEELECTLLKVGHRGTMNIVVEGMQDFEKVVWV
jgi:DNA-binding transcriptional LysR family regulator